ncbi:MAG: endolytic transglycosylase MltG [Chloroflexota bacterium]|nr:endolytic transglycosylase MltG [Chloroflexota bacterium]
MKGVGRILAFLGALIAIVVAIVSVSGFLARSTPGGGSVSLSLCGLSAPDDLVIGAYLDARASELEQPAGNDDTPVTFVIEPGETAVDIAERLKGEGLISDTELFRRYVQYHDLDAGIEVGEFTLRQTMTIPEIAQVLQRGQRPEQVVTIQEGLRLEQVAAAVAAQTSIPEGEFLVLVTTGWRDIFPPLGGEAGGGATFDFLADLPPTATLEGFLLPETYRLAEDATATDLLARMLGIFDERVTPEMRAAAANRGLSVYELVTLASIVEREAVLDEERPVIAGVYYNRLEGGWFLGACPTVQYAMGTADDWWPRFTLEATDVESPYNTYRNLNLPPGPICSPGLAAIQASAYLADTEYYFFLVDCTKNDGSHLFAATQVEHNSNYQMCGGELP